MEGVKEVSNTGLRILRFAKEYMSGQGSMSVVNATSDVAGRLKKHDIEVEES